MKKSVLVFHIILTLAFFYACEKECAIKPNREFHCNNNSEDEMTLFPDKKYPTKSEILENYGLIAIAPPTNYIPLKQGVWDYDTMYILVNPDGTLPLDPVSNQPLRYELYGFTNAGDINRASLECTLKLIM